MSNLNYTETEKFIFFYGSFYSQWTMRKMIIDNIKYYTCEQFMMAEKAKLFNDKIALEKIMESRNPRDQKALGRKVKNFNKEKWDKVCREIVYKGNYAKFTQHNDLKLKLLETGNKIIVEASPFDKIWGIGLGEKDERCLDSKKWRGTNWLGKAIMEVRDKIREEEYKEQVNEARENPEVLNIDISNNFRILWMVKNFGFGEFTFYKNNDKLYINTEYLSKEFIKKIINNLIDVAIDDKDIE